MDGSITDEQAHAWLQDIADGGWVSLHFESPALASSDRAEIIGGGYTRYKMPFSQPMNRTIWSLDDARFVGLIQTKITYFGIWTKQYKGWLRAYGELPEPTVVLTGKGFVLPAHQLVISVG